MALLPSIAGFTSISVSFDLVYSVKSFHALCVLAAADSALAELAKGAATSETASAGLEPVAINTSTALTEARIPIQLSLQKRLLITLTLPKIRPP